VITLIVNADDFGFSAGVSAAVGELAASGSISSTSIMVNMPHVEDITRVATANPRLGIGLHVNLSQGRPVLAPEAVPSLVDPNGNLLAPRVLARRGLLGRVSAADVRREVTAQIARARALVGDRLDHWDSHQGTHRFEPIASAVLSACAEQGLEAMRSHRHRFISNTGAGGTDSRSGASGAARSHGVARALKEQYYAWLTRRGAARFAVPDGLLTMSPGTTVDVLACVTRMPRLDGVFEIPCHPASTLEGLPNTRMTQSRLDEFEFLRSPEWRQAVADGRVQLVSFAWLAAETRGSKHELATASV
jgi:predicted glycoside hydrolase/deacetylase ChbG (UPF0249 family)